MFLNAYLEVCAETLYWLRLGWVGLGFMAYQSLWVI